MEDTSIFQDKGIDPSENDLVDKFGMTFHLWKQLRDFVLLQYPAGMSQWYHSGKKHGWSFRIKDKKRVLVYFLPRSEYFKVALVFGQKATDFILSGNISAAIKTELEQALKYAEEHGIWIDIKNDLTLPDIEKLIEVKLKY